MAVGYADPVLYKSSDFGKCEFCLHVNGDGWKWISAVKGAVKSNDIEQSGKSALILDKKYSGSICIRMVQSGTVDHWLGKRIRRDSTSLSW
jgi:hypothetical protein